MADIEVKIHSLFDLLGDREIRPRERFSFSVTATNSSEADAVQLENVRYHVKVEDPTMAKLVVPSRNPDQYGTGYDGSSYLEEYSSSFGLKATFEINPQDWQKAKARSPLGKFRASCCVDKSNTLCTGTLFNS